METNNKLREACANIAEYARSAMCHTTDAHVLGYLNQIEGWAKAALAEPVRNCEKHEEIVTELPWLVADIQLRDGRTIRFVNEEGEVK